ncbi:hypothetical protein [Nocardia sp. NPDC020380]|uniref:VG15 protein n=1 Tax=Nocardia sp. NPDC020380 TaxID=3364309 RepID=UPI0037BD70E6
MDVIEFREVLGDLNTVMVRDIDSMFRAASRKGISSAEFWRLIVQAYPEIVAPHMSAAGELAAFYYDSQAPELTFRAAPAPLPATAQLQASARWALKSPAAVDLLSGSAQRVLFGQARETVSLSAGRERGATWARYASFTACPFCRMNATRGDVYRSEDTADMQFHDNCRCMAVPVRPGGKYEPPAYVEQWEDEYKAARAAADSGDPNAILSAWRRNLSEAA